MPLRGLRCSPVALHPATRSSARPPSPPAPPAPRLASAAAHAFPGSFFSNRSSSSSQPNGSAPRGTVSPGRESRPTKRPLVGGANFGDAGAFHELDQAAHVDRLGDVFVHAGGQARSRSPFIAWAVMAMIGSGPFCYPCSPEFRSSPETRRSRAFARPSESGRSSCAASSTASRPLLATAT